MIDLKKYNYFTGDKSSVAYGVSDIVKFLDLAGHNYVLFTPPRPTGSSKFHDICLYHYFLCQFSPHISTQVQKYQLEFQDRKWTSTS